MALSAQELFAIEMAPTGMGNKKIDHAGLAAVDEEAVVAEAAFRFQMVSHNVGLQFSSHISRIVLDLCVF